MIRNAVRIHRVSLVLALGSFLAACGSSNNTTMESTGTSLTPIVLVTLSPSSTALSTGQGQSAQFTATVSGSSNTAVNWSANGVAGGSSTLGTISSGGLYASPATPTSQVVTVTATSVADSTKSASSSVILVTPGQVSSTQHPQVAQYSFTSPTDATVTVQFGLDTSYGQQTWSQPVPAGGGTLNMLVAGMQANTTYHMSASVSFSSGVQYVDSDHTFTTGAGLPAARIPQITITQPTTGLTPNPGIELLDLTGGSEGQIEAAAIGLSGNLIWYYDFPTTGGAQGNLPFPIKLLPNGHMLIAIGWAADAFNAGSTLREIDLAGNTIRELPIAQLNTALANAGSSLTALGYHHDFALLPNGHTVVLVMQQKVFSNLPGLPGDTTVTGDALVDLDPNWNPVWTWSTFDYLDVTRQPLGASDWTHSNAVIYSPTDHDLILSMRNQSWIIKIDYQNGTGSGNIVWTLGYQGDFTLVNGTTPVDWFYNQHYPVLLSALSVGSYQLGLWDNGTARVLDNSGTVCSWPAPACFSRGLTLQINEPARTATILWQYQPDVVSYCCGDYHILNNSDVEMDTGLNELSPESSLILEVTPTSTPAIVWQMNLNGQIAYRAFRMPSLYPGVQW